MPSSFFHPTPTTKANQLVSLHLSRNELLPVTLSTKPTRSEDTGYAEGVVTNTKFGSFPHSTLIGVPWGAQVLASKVDTGTRGRTGAGVQQQRSRKRKRGQERSIGTRGDGQDENEEVEEQDDDEENHVALREAVAATSGFLHVLPPTPESWTSSLPHRTQVVYTPDYSYILHRLRARPGSRLIEAGSGSGSFTHAAARAVYTGEGQQRPGQVFTFEFHAERHQRVLEEMREHELETVVTATHRDVYKGGFWLNSNDGTDIAPQANAVFLDLPAPWEALQHLTRESKDGKPSALDPEATVHICTFSPCIEQVQKTVSVMRKLGWLEIDMVEIQHKRIDVRREYNSLSYEGYRGVNLIAANVDEAVAKLQEVENNARAQHRSDRQIIKAKRTTRGTEENPRQQDAGKVLYRQGQIVSRSEPELKTHTSYLVFAILPRLWSAEDEDSLRAQTPQNQGPAPLLRSKKQLKKEMKQQKRSGLSKSTPN